MARKRLNPVRELDLSDAERAQLQRDVNRQFGGRGARLRKAAKIYADFTGDSDVTAVAMEVPDMPREMVKIGMCDEIGYTCVRDGKTERYSHTFKKKSRPLLAASIDGKRLFLLGGAFTFGERGIVDDPN